MPVFDVAIQLVSLTDQTDQLMVATKPATPMLAKRANLIDLSKMCT